MNPKPKIIKRPSKLKVEHCECDNTGRQQLLIDLGHKSFPKAKAAKEQMIDLLNREWK